MPSERSTAPKAHCGVKLPSNCPPNTRCGHFLQAQTTTCTLPNPCHMPPTLPLRAVDRSQHPFPLVQVLPPPISVRSRCIFNARSISPDALLQRSTAPDIPWPVVQFFHTLRPGRTVVILQHTNVVVCHVAMTTTPNCDTERQSPLQFALPAAFTPHTSLSPPPNELPLTSAPHQPPRNSSAPRRSPTCRQDLDR